MSILRGQSDVSAVVPLATDRVDDASTVTAVTSETVVWYFVSSSVWAAAVGEAAATLCTAKLAFTGILNSMKSAVGSYNDTSLSLGATTRFDTRISVPESVFSEIQFMSPTDQKAAMLKYLTTNGYYAVDHRRGQLWGVAKATVANDAASYSYMAPVSGSGGPSSSVNIAQLGGTSVTAANTSRAATDKVLLVQTLDGNGKVGTAGSSTSTGYVGKPSGTNGDFVTAYASATTLTCTGLPTGVSAITMNDIVKVLQVTTAGVVTQFDRSTTTLTCSGSTTTTISIPAATFAASDVFVVETNIARRGNYAEDAAHTTGDYGNVMLAKRTDTAASSAGTDGDYTTVNTDAAGNMWSTLGTYLSFEDTTNNLGWVHHKPTAASDNAISGDISAALEASTITKASAGRVYSISGRIDSTAPTGIHYIQLLNSATLPADGAVTILRVWKYNHSNGIDTPIDIDLGIYGVYGSAGLILVDSSTEFTKTIQTSTAVATVTNIEYA